MKTRTECEAEIKIDVPSGINVQTISSTSDKEIRRQVVIRSYRHPTEEAAELAIVETVRKLAEKIWGEGVI